MSGLGGKRTLAGAGKLDGEACSATLRPRASLQRALKLFGKRCDHAHPETSGSCVWIKAVNQAASFIAHDEPVHVGRRTERHINPTSAMFCGICHKLVGNQSDRLDRGRRNHLVIPVNDDLPTENRRKVIAQAPQVRDARYLVRRIHIKVTMNLRYCRHPLGGQLKVSGCLANIG